MKLRSMLLSLCVIGLPLAASAADTYQQKLFVGGTKSNEVYVIDVATNKIIQTINPLFKVPHGFAATKDGAYVWINSWDDGVIVKVDTVRGEVVERYKIASGGDDLELVNNDRDLYVAGWTTACYFVFDTVQKKVVQKIPTEGLPHNVVIPKNDQRFIYLAPMGSSGEQVSGFARNVGGTKDCEGKNTQSVGNHLIHVVDTKTQKDVGTIDVGTAPRPIVVTDDGKRMYVNVDDLLGFKIVDLDTRKVIGQVEYPLTDDQKAEFSRSHGIGIPPNQKEVWSTSVNHDIVYFYDRTGSEPPRYIGQVGTGKTPYWITYSIDGKTGYVSNQGDGTISAIDVASHKEIARIQLPKDLVPKLSLVVNVPVSRQSTE